MEDLVSGRVGEVVRIGCEPREPLSKAYRRIRQPDVGTHVDAAVIIGAQLHGLFEYSDLREVGEVRHSGRGRGVAHNPDRESKVSIVGSSPSWEEGPDWVEGPGWEEGCAVG
jgi:hypothetical protein